MATEKITFCIGYVGMTLQYHTIEVVENNTCILQESIVKEKFKRQEEKNTHILQESVVKERFKRQEKKTVMLSPRRKFFSVHKPKKKKRESRSKFRE